MTHLCRWCGQSCAEYSAQLVGDSRVFWFCNAECHEALLRAEEEFE